MTWLLLLLLLTTMSASAETTAQPDMINLGIAYPLSTIDDDTFFKEGYQLAIDEINEQGGLLGKLINPVIRDDNNDITTGLIIAQSFIDHKMNAVIGHWSSNVCYVVKDLYESNGMIMISPAATSEKLFEGSPNYIFTSIPGGEAFAKTTADGIAAMNKKCIAIYYSDDVYGFTFANMLEAALRERGIQVVDRVTNITKANLERIKRRWIAYGVDGAFVAAVMPQAKDAISMIREMDPDLAIFGAENFDRRHFIDEIGGNAKNVYRATYDLSGVDPDFLSAYESRYGHKPGVFAISGYRAVKLYAEAVIAANTLESAAIASAIKAIEPHYALALRAFD